jgi:hypothetical protein
VPLTTHVAFSSTNSTFVPSDTWVSLIGGPASIIGLSFPLQLQGYVLNLTENDRLRFVIDGMEVVKAPPEYGLLYITQPLLGPHTVDFQAIAGPSEDQVQAGPRGFTAIDLGLVVP